MVCTKLIKIEFWNLEFKQMYKGIPFRFLKKLNLNVNHIITAKYHSLARQYCICLFFVARSKYTAEDFFWTDAQENTIMTLK